MNELEHPAYGRLRTVNPLISVVLQRNPGMMTLDGTNSWVLRAPDAAGCVIVDPGEDDAEHLRLLAECAPVELVLITHGHHDHVGAAESFARMINAPVRALDPALCRDGEPLTDGLTITGGGLHIEVRHTPGHTDDSVSLMLTHPRHAAVLTGDTVLGAGTTVLSDLGDYLDSLRLLENLLDAMPANTVGLPGHGPELRRPLTTVREYLAHR
ncbi:MAG: MBL fold metallo-hydrolase, partial [Sciscionella sp.]|nr:MBL fold metallo-hydrolase [Sciscionella sp.]